MLRSRGRDAIPVVKPSFPWPTSSSNANNRLGVDAVTCSLRLAAVVSMASILPVERVLKELHATSVFFRLILYIRSNGSPAILPTPIAGHGA
jgi:hypothetical protein